jgi:large subunit ribosomal protein L4
MTSKVNKKGAKTSQKNKAKAKVCDLAGVKKGEADISVVFDGSISDKVLTQAVLVERDRERVRKAHTKDRKEVRGGGAKPWRQKGTGRARHGSRRSPLWVGGGTTFGPKSNKSVNLFMPKDLRRRALLRALDWHVKSNSISFLKLGKLPEKTKELDKKIGKTGKVLIVVDDKHSGLNRAARNIKHVRVKQVDQVKVQDFLWANNVWVSVEAVERLEQRVGGGIKIKVSIKGGAKKSVKSA